MALPGPGRLLMYLRPGPGLSVRAKAWTCSHPPGVCQALPSGPSRSRATLWDTYRGTLTPARAISCRATRRKWVAANSSSKTTRTMGIKPWSSRGRREE